MVAPRWLRHRARMKRHVWIFASGAVCAACSSPPPSAPIPTVALSAVPPPPSASTPLPAPSDTADAGAPQEPEVSCTDQVDQVKSIAHTTMEDCNQIKSNVKSILQKCDPGLDEEVWSTLHSADCMQDVIDDHFAELNAKLSTTDQAKQSSAHSLFRSDLEAHCTRSECTIGYTAYCTARLLACRDDHIEAARRSALAFEKAEAFGKEIREFSDYAKRLCSLPKSAWQDGKVPTDCVNRVLSSLEQCVGTPVGCMQL